MSADAVLSASVVRGFARRLLAWHPIHGRSDLPWQGCRDPYRVWLSEIMLQQTQVVTVLGYYQRFLERFPGYQLSQAPLRGGRARFRGFLKAPFRLA